MGRPVNKRVFGNPATTAGNQLYLFADIGAGVEQCFIVKQTATRQFRVESVGSGDQAEVLLVNGPAGVTGPGFGYIEAGAAGSNLEVEAAAVADAGTGYAPADTITLAGGTGTAAVLTVQTVGGSGEVLTVAVTNPGDYSVAPTNPVSQGSTSGIGTGATFNLTFGSTSDEFVNLLSNKNLKVFGLGRETYTINGAVTADRDLSGE